MKAMNRRQFEKYLRKAGFVLRRQTKHNIWEHPDGRIIPVSQGGNNEMFMTERQLAEVRRAK